MPRYVLAVLAAFMMAVGLAACDDDEAEIETPAGEIEVERD